MTKEELEVLKGIHSHLTLIFTIMIVAFLLSFFGTLAVLDVLEDKLDLIIELHKPLK